MRYKSENVNENVRIALGVLVVVLIDKRGLAHVVDDKARADNTTGAAIGTFMSIQQYVHDLVGCWQDENSSSR